MAQLLLIGLDSATYDYLDPWLERGELPNLKALLARSARGVLRSTIPPVTSVAWTSMVTGLNPGRFGIYDLVTRRNHTYRFVPATFLNTHRRAIWDLLSARGRRVAIIGVPSTYPAVAINGLFIAGFDSPPRGDRLAHPPDLLSRLEAAGVPYPWKALEHLLELERRRLVVHRMEEYLDCWQEVTSSKAEIVRWILLNEVCDFVMVVFSSTDHIVHHAPSRDVALHIYRQVDQAMGRILEVVPSDAFLIVASDHGSTETDYFVTLYRILHDQGWLAFRNEIGEENVRWLVRRIWPSQEARIARIWNRMPSTLRRGLSWPWVRLDPRLGSTYRNIDWSRTRVYAPTSHGPLYLNVRGREPEGIVAPGAEYEHLREEVIEALKRTRDPQSGQPLFAWVRRGEEVYHGPYASPPPDLVFAPRDYRYKVVTGFATQPMVRPNPSGARRYVEYGWHTPEGMVALSGPGIRSGNMPPADIWDIAPTVLYLLGEPVPGDLDGRLLSSALQPSWLQDHPLVRGPAFEPDQAAPSSEEWASEDLASVEDHLRGLGYLG